MPQTGGSGRKEATARPPGRVPRGRAQRPPRRCFPNGCWCCLEVNIHATVLRCDIDTLRSAAICSLSYTGTDDPPMAASASSLAHRGVWWQWVPARAGQLWPPRRVRGSGGPQQGAGRVETRA
jgi:hypothetical protein